MTETTEEATTEMIVIEETEEAAEVVKVENEVEALGMTVVMIGRLIAVVVAAEVAAEVSAAAAAVEVQAVIPPDLVIAAENRRSLRRKRSLRRRIAIVISIARAHVATKIEATKRKKITRGRR